MTHFASLLADLVVTATRAQTVEQLPAVRAELIEGFEHTFALLSHDAAGGLNVLEDLNARLLPESWGLRA